MKNGMNKGLEMVIGAHTIPVVVSSEGVFWAEWDGDSVRSETFKGLRAKLLPKVRTDAKRCAVPALLREYAADWTPITLIGLHADNGNVLYRGADETTKQLSRRDRRIYRPLSPAELTAHAQLLAVVATAQGVLNRWLKKRVLLPGAAVRKAIGLPADPDRDRDDRVDEEEDLT